MRRTSLVLVFIALICASNSASAAVGDTLAYRVAYYPSWCMRPQDEAGLGLPPQNIDWGGLTHVIIFGNGNRVVTSSPYWGPCQNSTDSIDITHGADGGSYDYLDSTVAIVHRAGLKILISINQASPTNFDAISGDSAKIETLSSSLVMWCLRHKIDGWDLDLEASSSSAANINRFIRIGRRTSYNANFSNYISALGLPGFPNGRALIGIAAGRGDHSKYWGIQDSMVTFYDLQLYSMQYMWNGSAAATYFQTAAHHVAIAGCANCEAAGLDYDPISSSTAISTAWTNTGHALSKLVFGIATEMGGGFTGISGLSQSKQLNCTYSGSVSFQRLQNTLAMTNYGGTYTWNDVAQASYVWGTATAGNPCGISAGTTFFLPFEDSLSGKSFADTCKKYGVGGVMIYDYSMGMETGHGNVKTWLHAPHLYAIAAYTASLHNNAAPSPPSAPTLSSPSNGATSVSTSPTLNWNAASGVSSYQLQVSTISSFTTTVVNQSGITATSYAVTGLTGNTTYYWHVDATNDAGTSAYSATWSFTTADPPSPPSAPTLSSPSNGATGLSTSPTLNWNASTGATSYQLQVSTNSSFTTTVMNQSGITGTSYAVSGLSYSTTYYWRVNATNAGGTSTYSTTWSLTTAAPPPPPSAPTLSSPSNGATGVSTSPTLSWNASASAASYQLQVSTISSFTTTVVNQSGITGTSYAVSSLSDSTTYYWRVNATNDGGASAYSTTWSFTTATASSALVLAYSFNEGAGTTVNDASNQGNSGTISGAIWTSSGRYGNALTFNGTNSRVGVANSPSLSPSTNRITICCWIYPTDLSSQWYTIMQRNNAASTWFDWQLYARASDAQTPNHPVFRVDWNGDNLIDAGDEVQGDIVLSTNTWYFIACTYDGTNMNFYINGTLRGSTPKAGGTMPNGGQGIWIGGNSVWGEYFKGTIDEVQIYNQALSQSEIQEAMNTPIGGTVLPPSAPTLSSPSDGVTGISITPTLSWSASSGATSYQLQVSTSSSFTTTALNQSGITATSYAVGGLTNNTIYYWRVNATNAGGTSAYSSAWSFTTSISHGIVLPQGWSLISSVAKPPDSTLNTVLAKILPNIELMKNGTGQVFWPALSINTIGSWNYHEGYQVHMLSADTLTITGSEITPETTPVPLIQGVTLVPYLRHSPMQADSALASVQSSLVIAKDNAGNVYWPSFAINSIGVMKPSQGYQVQVSQACTLVYPANASPGPPTIVAKQTGPANSSSLPSPLHYHLQASNTGANAVLLVEGCKLKDGDEIAAWTTRKVLVGCGAMNQGRALLTIWGDNTATEDIVEGAKEGEPLSLTFWSAAEQKEGSLTVSSLLDAVTSAKAANSLCYKTDAVWVAQAIQAVELPKAFSLSQNYPNPFNPSTVIRYALPSDAMVTLEVFNILGQRVALTVNEEQKAGNHEVIFQNSTLGSGLYFYRLTAGKFTETRKMIIVR
jgi:hypothetical protein